MAMKPHNVQYFIDEFAEITFWWETHKKRTERPTVQQHKRIVEKLRKLNSLILNTDLDLSDLSELDTDIHSPPADTEYYAHKLEPKPCSYEDQDIASYENAMAVVEEK